MLVNWNRIIRWLCHKWDGLNKWIKRATSNLMLVCRVIFNGFSHVRKWEKNLRAWQKVDEKLKIPMPHNISSNKSSVLKIFLSHELEGKKKDRDRKTHDQLNMGSRIGNVTEIRLNVIPSNGNFFLSHSNYVIHNKSK